MTTLQLYLDNKYSNSTQKEEVKKISISEIHQEYLNQGESELLEGGELDLRAYPNIEEVIIDNQLLATPVTKVNTEGLNHLKEVSWSESTPKPEESQEEKQFYQALGISTDSDKKKLVQEIQKLTKLFSEQKLSNKKINLTFATAHSPQEKLGEKTILAEKTEEEVNIYLQLERKDKQGNFSPYLILWSLAQELTSLEFQPLAEDPSFWLNLWSESGIYHWIKDNLTTNYQAIWELLANPVNFPAELLDWGLLQLFFPNWEDNSNFLILKTIISKSLIAEFWPVFWQESIELVYLLNNLIFLN